jgi:muramoyltetrapeptide carboxypeptidase
VAQIESLGFAVRLGDGVLERRGFTAGLAQTRLAQLHDLLSDPDVKAVWCARGGAGALHLLPHLDRAWLGALPKLLVGYSDATVLHAWLGQAGLTSVHGPMVAWEMADGSYDRASLWHALTGEGEPWASGHGELRARAAGTAQGVLRGGCLSLLAALAGTPWALRAAPEPTLLFIEDVDERPYRVDRLLRQLRLSGALAGVAGIVFGEMKGCAPRAGEGYGLDEVLLEALEGLGLPVAAGLSSGHAERPVVALPLGVHARLECGEDAAAALRVLEAPVS